MTMCVNIGHGDERVIEAIVAQARELPFAAPGMATRARAHLGQLLSEVVPGGLTKFLYTLGGADANENAIKLARGYTGRLRFWRATVHITALHTEPSPPLATRAAWLPSRASCRAWCIS